MPLAQIRSVLSAIRGYETTYPHYDETFDEVGDRIRVRGWATKSDISALVFWKRVRVGPWGANLLNRPDSEVAEATGNAFASGLSDAARLTALAGLPGFAKGGPICSTVLAAWDPLHFPVLDDRASEALRRLKLTSSPGTLRYLEYLSIVRSLRDRLKSHRPGITARQVDQGLYVLGGRPGGKPRLMEGNVSGQPRRTRGVPADSSDQVPHKLR